MKLKKALCASVAALTVIASGQAVSFAQSPSPAKVTVTPSQRLKSISPYIYGVNFEADLNTVAPKSIRMGGNRMSAYNWETNASNAGSDWNHTSDMYVVRNLPEQLKNVPAGLAQGVHAAASSHNIPYTLFTLQMLGYVSNDQNGDVPESSAAPSDRWAQVVNRKGGELDSYPNVNDGKVYMDEYLNYLTNELGNSGSGGIRGYELDNEPALWSSTHSRVQRQPVTCTELLTKSIDLAQVIKEADPGADVFGPSLYGYMAFVSLQDASDWEGIKSANGYRWFIDCYLDEIKKASDANGSRLLDVLDLHFYTEQKGACGERSCNHYDNDACVKARLDSVRALYDENYVENSWITDTGAQFFPLLPNVKQSIDQYYPGTKLSFTEYNFGGGDHISGAVAQADTLGVFAENDVYFASIWAFENAEYQFAAINMFTDYDGQGSGFGDTLVKSECENGDIKVYSSVDGEDEGTVKIIVTNHSLHEQTPLEINLSSNNEYNSAEVYALYGDSASIRTMPAVSIDGNTLQYTLEPLSVTEFVVRGTPNAATSEPVSSDVTEDESSTVPESTPDAVSSAPSQSGTSTAPSVSSNASDGGFANSLDRWLIPVAIGALALVIGVVALVIVVREKKHRKK